MPKYRSLSLEELHALEKEFVEYLILNGIIADDWEKLKKDDRDKADQIIDLFSDVVFESIFRKVEFLEFRKAKELRTYQCLADKLILVGMKADPLSDTDFTDPAYIQKASQAPPDSLKVYTIEKPYSKERELELFEMTEAGCMISDGRTFKILCLALSR